MDNAFIPMKIVGPLKIVGPHLKGEIKVPLATYETPLWPSVSRGARISRETEGISVVMLDDRMTRSVLLEATSSVKAVQLVTAIKADKAKMQEVVGSSSNYARLIDINFQVVANLLYIRFEMTTGDAAGHNMVTKAADQLISWCLINTRT